MKRLFTLIGCMTLVLIALQSHAQVSDGTYRIFTHSFSARSAAMGGIPLSMHDGDLQNVVFNPSSISPEMNNQLTLSYVGDFNLETHYGTVQYSHTFERLGSFATTVQYYNYGDMQYASESGYADGSTFNVSDYAITLGWGRELTEKWSIGANLKYAGLQREVGRAGALGVDVAATYWSYSNWAFSLAARNVGRQLFSVEMNTEDKWLPYSVDFTASKKLDHLPLTLVLGYKDIQRWKKVDDNFYSLDENYDVITGELKQPSNTVKFFNNLGSHLVFGGELDLGKNLVLRASYNYETRFKMDVPTARTLVGFSAGFAVKIKAFQIDYARSRNNIVGSANFLTLRLDMSKL